MKSDREIIYVWNQVYIVKLVKQLAEYLVQSVLGQKYAQNNFIKNHNLIYVIYLSQHSNQNIVNEIFY